VSAFWTISPFAGGEGAWLSRARASPTRLAHKFEDLNEKYTDPGLNLTALGSPALSPKNPMQDPASHSIRTDASAVKYGLIVAAISLALLTVLIGIGANLTIGHFEAAIR
jgi:hypothetical protein